jgi:hypothetical protein
MKYELTMETTLWHVGVRKDYKLQEQRPDCGSRMYADGRAEVEMIYR